MRREINWAEGGGVAHGPGRWRDDRRADNLESWLTEAAAICACAATWNPASPSPKALKHPDAALHNVFRPEEIACEGGPRPAHPQLRLRQGRRCR